MDTQKYTTISVTKDLKQRITTVAEKNRRSVPQQLERWCDRAEDEMGQDVQPVGDCADKKNSTDLK